MASTKMFRGIVTLVLVTYRLSAIVLVEAEVASPEFLINQKVVWEILLRVDQPHLAAEHYDLGKDYIIEKYMGSYTNQEYVTAFLKIYKKGMLPRGETFSPFYPAILEQAIALFRVFYVAKDFDTLHKTAAWARIHLNEGMFVYAFSVAVFHHPETHRLRIPAHHEIYPNLYFDDTVIRKAYDAVLTSDPTNTTIEEIVIPASYSKFYQKYIWEDKYKLSYYTEDVDLNDLRYDYHLKHPFWMSAKEFSTYTERGGEKFFGSYHFHNARYYMERLSNDLGEVEDFDWDHPVPYGYGPSTSYRNGMSLPHREAHAEFPKYNHELIQKLKTWEDKISQAISSGDVIDADGKFISIRGKEGLNILGNLIEGNANSLNPNDYGYVERATRTVLGFSPQPVDQYKVYPSTMQFYSVDQRDPMHWSLSKKIERFYEKYTTELEKYTSEELTLPDVKIDSVELGPIITFFSPAEYLISNAVKVHGSPDKTVIKARQYRLDHEPYQYIIAVTSKKEMKANVRVFLGPKYDYKQTELNFNENYMKFVVLDEWTIDLKVGSNKFERNSKANRNAAADQVSGDVFYKKILNAIDGKETYEIPGQPFGFPERMMIPKGTKEGMTFKLFTFVTPSSEDRTSHGEPLALEDSPPPGFPLDRRVPHNLINLPNAHFANFQVFHQEEMRID